MISLKARVYICLMRNRHIFKGKLKKESFPCDKNAVLEFREECEKGAKRFGKLPKGIETKQEVINLTLSEWLIPENAPTEKLIFYVHGGGMVHCYPLLAPMFKEATKAMNEIVGFVKQQLYL